MSDKGLTPTGSGSGPGGTTWEIALVGCSSHWWTCDSSVGVGQTGQGCSICQQVGKARPNLSTLACARARIGFRLCWARLSYLPVCMDARDGGRLNRARLQHPPTRVGTRAGLGHARLQHPVTPTRAMQSMRNQTCCKMLFCAFHKVSSLGNANFCK